MFTTETANLQLVSEVCQNQIFFQVHKGLLEAALPVKA